MAVKDNHNQKRSDWRLICRKRLAHHIGMLNHLPMTAKH